MDGTPDGLAGSLPQGVAPEERPFGKYVLRYLLGSGGMATVYLGCVRSLGGFERSVAIKRMHPHLTHEREFVDMFLDEARIASRITHPNVCAVYEFGEHDGTYYIAMEYLSGVALHEVVHKISGRRALLDSPGWQSLAAHIVQEAAEGLHAAHEARDLDGAPLHVVHRDVSPHNVVLTFDGGVKVLDFGIAKARRRIRGTQTGGLKGKLAYMSPEHASGADIDRRADVWALGVMLWEMLTGLRLFKKNNEMDSILAVQSMPIPPPSAVLPSVPEALDRIVLRALSRDRDARHATARELARDLASFLHDQALPSGRIELSERLQQLFGAQRETEQIRLREVVAAASGAHDLPPPRSLTETERPIADAPTALLSMPSTDSGFEPNPADAGTHPGAPLGTRGGWIALGSAAVLMAIGGVGFALYGQGGSAVVEQPVVHIVPEDAREEAPESGREEARGGATDHEPASQTPPTEGSAPQEPAVTAPIEPPERTSRVTSEATQPEPIGARPGQGLDPAAAVAEEESRPRRARRRRPPRRSVERAPEAPPGNLNLVTTGGWAEVYLGSRHLGQTPIAGRSLPAGRHRLRLVAGSDRSERSVTVQIRPGETTRAHVELD